MANRKIDGGTSGEATRNADISIRVVEQLQATNQLLRRQAIIIIVASFIMYALMDLSQTQWNRNQDMYNKIQTLEHFRDASDLRSYLQENEYNIEMTLMHEIDTDALFYKLESRKYIDRLPIIEAISILKDRRRNLWGISDKTISISGVSVPISTWFYFVPLVIFILFHNFTQIINYRHRLLRKLSSIEDWEQGPYLAGFRNAPSLDAPSKYLTIVSSLIALEHQVNSSDKV